ncbi:hypothetical protein LTR49_021747 [Elasticomyces elasticus]|nr:hypothetical protein LTR49_021747 [Elasticomyces elasticus]
MSLTKFGDVETADQSNAEAIETTLAVMDKLIEVNTTAMVHDELKAVVATIRTIFDQPLAASAAFAFKPALKYPRRIEQRLGLRQTLPDAGDGTKTTGGRAFFELARERPGELSDDGPRHDNDHVDIRQISILPSLQEIQSPRIEYLPLADPLEWHIGGLRGLLDRHFRLLREDTVGQLRDAAKFELERLHDHQGQGRKRQGARTFVYRNVAVSNLAFDSYSGMEFALSFDQPRELQGKSERQRHDWWDGSKRLGQEALICLLSSEGSATFFIVSPAPLRPKKDFETGAPIEPLYKSYNLWSEDERAHVVAKPVNQPDMYSLLDQLMGGFMEQLSLVEFPDVLLPAFKPTLQACLRRVHVSRQAMALSPRSICKYADSLHHKGITLRYCGSQFSQPPESPNTQSGQTEQFVALLSSIGALAQHQNLIPRQTIALLRSTSERPERQEWNPERTGSAIRQQNKKGIAGQLALFDLLHSAVWRVGFGLPAALDEQGFRYDITPNGLDPKLHDTLSALVEAGQYSMNHNGQVAIGGLLLETESFANISIAPSPDAPFASKLLVKRKSEPEFVHPSGVVVSLTHVPIKRDHAIGLLKLLKIAQVGWYKMDQPSRDVLLSGIFTENSDATQTLMTQNHSLDAISPVFTELEHLTGFSMKQSLDVNVGKTVNRMRSAFRNQDELKEAFLCGDILNEMVQPLRYDQEGLQAEWPERLKQQFTDSRNGAKAIAYAFHLRDRWGRCLHQKGTHSPAYLPSIDQPIHAELISPDLVAPKNIAAILSIAVLVAEQYILEQVLTRVIRGDKRAYDTLTALLGNAIAFDAVTIAREIMSSTDDLAAPLLGRQFCSCDNRVAVIRHACKTNYLIQYIERLFTGGFTGPNVNTFAALAIIGHVGDKVTEFMRSTSPDIHGRDISAGLSLVCQHLQKAQL